MAAVGDRPLNCVSVVVCSVIRKDDIWGGGTVVGKVREKVGAEMLQGSVGHHGGALSSGRVRAPVS